MRLLVSIGMLWMLVGLSCRPAPAIEEVAFSSLDCSPRNTQALHMANGAHLRGMLVATRFHSFAQLLETIEVQYGHSPTDTAGPHTDRVQLLHCSNGQTVTSILTEGVSERDFSAAQTGGFWERVSLLFQSPASVRNRYDLQRVSILARRRPDVFGEGDPAFYDISKAILRNISKHELPRLDSVDLASDKGYFNSFNHITAQVFMTALFSEDVADLVADAHERKNMPELISGAFSEEQRTDLANGPVDNYVDMINNEWGQELGKALRKRHQLSRSSDWRPVLLTDFLNDIQRYYAWGCQMRFEPFRPSDEIIQKFSTKLRAVMRERGTL